MNAGTYVQGYVYFFSLVYIAFIGLVRVFSPVSLRPDIVPYDLLLAGKRNPEYWYTTS